MQRAGPVARSVLSDLVKDHLLEAIMAGVYPPGSRIVETQVARELGTSQAPVREALRDLEGLGIVELAAFRGARVRHPSRDELLEAYGVRTELETYAARLALPRISDADVAELEEYVDRMRQAAARGDAHAEALADVTFHGRIVEMSGNRTLTRVWRTLEPASRTYITLAIPGANLPRVADLHEPILEALRHRDDEGAADALRGHFETIAATFGALWDASPPVGPPPAAASAEGRGTRRRRPARPAATIDSVRDRAS